MQKKLLKGLKKWKSVADTSKHIEPPYATKPVARVIQLIPPLLSIYRFKIELPTGRQRFQTPREVIGYIINQQQNFSFQYESPEIEESLRNALWSEIQRHMQEKV